MKIIIKATNIRLTDEIRSYLAEKINSLEKYLSGRFVEVRAEVGQIKRGQKQGEIFRAEVNIKSDEDFFRAEQTEENIFAAIDLVKDELKREIYQTKDKKIALQRRGARAWKKRWAITPSARFKKSKFFKKK